MNRFLPLPRKVPRVACSGAAHSTLAALAQAGSWESHGEHPPSAGSSSAPLCSSTLLLHGIK